MKTAKWKVWKSLLWVWTLLEASLNSWKGKLQSAENNQNQPSHSHSMTFWRCDVCKQSSHFKIQLTSPTLSRRFHGTQLVDERLLDPSLLNMLSHKHTAKLQLLDQLPIERITPGSVLDKVGADYAGLMLIKYGYYACKLTIVKAYICVLVSLMHSHSCTSRSSYKSHLQSHYSFSWNDSYHGVDSQCSYGVTIVQTFTLECAFRPTFCLGCLSTRQWSLCRASQ